MTYPIHRLPRGEIHVTRAENVYGSIDAGSVRLVISDGPYGMGKAAWDRQKGEDGLRAWYRPHVEAWGRVCMDAASVYVWGSDFSASALRPLMREHGWTLRVRVTWDKRTTPAHIRSSSWPDASEVADVYTRGEAPYNGATTIDDRGRVVACSNVWVFRAAGGGNFLSRERLRLPTFAAPKLAGQPSVLEPLHPCQKPLTFSDRIIRASSNPGDLVLEPFGGTCRAAVAIEAMQPADARRYVCIEPDEDGRGYVPAVLASMGHAREPVRDGLFAQVPA